MRKVIIREKIVTPENTRLPDDLREQIAEIKTSVIQAVVDNKMSHMGDDRPIILDVERDSEGRISRLIATKGATH